MAQDPFKYFRVEAAELLEQIGQCLLDLDREVPVAERLPALLRHIHTMKGAARVVKLPTIAETAHHMEDLLAPYRNTTSALPRDTIDQLLKLNDAIGAHVLALNEKPTPAATAIAPKPVAPIVEPLRSTRNDTSDVDALLERISGTVATLGGVRPTLTQVEQLRSWIDLLSKQLSAPVRDATRSTAPNAEAQALVRRLDDATRALERDLSEHVERLERDLEEVRTTAEGLRLVPASLVFTTLERAARDTARELGKQAHLLTRGGDTKLDGEVLFAVQDALVQVVCNAVAHGIEVPQERQRLGKPTAGTITVEVKRGGGRVVFVCSDDGRGLDIEAVRRELNVKQPTRNVERMDGATLLSLLPHAGISTATQVTGVSGRGVGLDIARDVVTRLGGAIRLESSPGQGFRVELDVPLSVAAFEALHVEAGGQHAMIPLDSIVRCERVTSDAVTHSNGRMSVFHEGQLIPMMPLSAVWPGVNTKDDRMRALLVVRGSEEHGQGHAAVGVERLLGTRSIMMRSLPVSALATQAVAGACLDALGNPLLVLDPAGLAAQAQAYQPNVGVPEPAALRVLVIDDSLTTRMMEQSILESAGYVVELAVSAEDGLQRAATNDYHLFLVDVEMPGMDGFSFVTQTRADPRLRKVPAVLVSSRNAPEDFARGKAAGASGYMVKSRFDQRELLALIETLVRSP